MLVYDVICDIMHDIFDIVFYVVYCVKSNAKTHFSNIVNNIAIEVNFVQFCQHNNNMRIIVKYSYVIDNVMNKFDDIASFIHIDNIEHNC